MKLIIVCLILFFPIKSFAQDILLVSQETHFLFRGENANRAHNINLIVNKIGTRTLQPGEEFSYNNIVGPRTRQAGFRRAHVIKRHQLVDDWGGGTCQGSGTLHAAILQTGLQIIESRQHSRISSYLPPGYDTTVAYGYYDFRFRNNFSSPIKIKMFIPQRGILRVEIYGQRRMNVQIEVQELFRRQFRTQRILNCHRLSPGQRDVVEQGTPDLFILRRRRINNQIEEERIRYFESNRIIEYCPERR